MSNFDSIFANIDQVPPSEAKSNQVMHAFDSNDANFVIIREVLSMLNGLNVEAVKKNPTDIFMLLKYRNDDIQLDDDCCQMIIRICGLAKLLLKIINYLNYYNFAKQDSLFTYPMFDEDVETKTLGNIKQYFVSSIHNEIKEYHYHLLMIEGKFRSLNVHYSFALRRILLWSSQWLNKFVFLSDILKSCLDTKGVLLLNNVYDFSRNGDPTIQKLARTILHQSLKPFIFNMFDWLLYGEISADIDQDFFICPKEKSIDDPESLQTEVKQESEWKLYELNLCMMPIFMNRSQVKKIFFIGNAVRLLRFMVKDEYDQRMVYEIFQNSPIQINYDVIKKFLYKHVEAYSTDERFFFEHSLVDDFDLLLDSYYDVVNEEMFKIMNLNEIKSEFRTVLAYVLMQRGDFYESLIDYLLPLLRKPAHEVHNIINGSCTNLHRIFHMFMVNAKLIELHQVYKIDSLLYNNFELSENLQFIFSKNVLKHHLGWDIFIVRYFFTKKVYRIMFDSKAYRYERLFRQLFSYKRVLFCIRQAQHQIMHLILVFKRKSTLPQAEANLHTIRYMLNTLHFLFFHMFGFCSRMYQYFGNQIASSWSLMFELEFKRKQKNIEKFVRAHERFLSSVERIVFFNQDHHLLTAYSALNDSIIDFCEVFCEEDLFGTLTSLATKEEGGDHSSSGNKLDEELFRHQFKISINISKYRCCMARFIELAQGTQFEFKFDILNYQPCLDRLFRCHTTRGTSSTICKVQT